MGKRKITLEEAAILIDGGCPEGFALEATGGENGLAHAWNDNIDGSLCGAVVSGAVPEGSQIRPWDNNVDCPGCLSLMSAVNRQARAVETIDLTPVGMSTPEGCKRVREAQAEFEDATHALANAVKERWDAGGYLLPSDRDKIRDLVGARDRKQEAFLRAVAGK